MTKKHDVLEQNVTTLLEGTSEPPRISDAARSRIRAELVAKHGADEPARWRLRTPIVVACAGIAAVVIAALALTRLIGGHGAREIAPGQLADGSTYITGPGGKLTVLGSRHVRVDGAVLLDVAPGKGTFRVETAAGRVEVLGTRFYVNGEPQRTVAAVVRGQVKLATDSGEVLLHAGEQGVAETGHAPTRGPAPRLSQLVGWAQGAKMESAAVEPLHHGTLFARDTGMRSHPPWGREYPLPIAKLALDVVVEDRVARVALDQTFHNNANQDLEGVYRFAIPPDAALQRLAMYVDGKLEESAVVERMAGRRIYEELVYRRVDPALLEWAGTGRLSLRVYPIPARQDKRIVLAYTQSLPRLYDDWTLTVPMPELDQPAGEFAATVRVKGCASCELSSTSHQITVDRDGDDAVVHYQHASDKLGDSFVLHVRDPRNAQTFTAQTDGHDRYMMVRAPIAMDAAPRVYKPRTWVILDDVSASRDTLELHAQRDLIDSFLHELDEDDRVAVVAFDVEARTKLAPTRVRDVDRKAVEKALAGEGGVGATDFEAGLDAATKLLDGTTDATILYVGDGVITAGPRELDHLLAKIAGKAQFVGVGVGDGPDTQTLGALAAATGGYTATIDLDDDVRWRAFDLVAALHTARVTHVNATLVDDAGSQVTAVAYLASPQLADGEQVELVAKLSGMTLPAAIELDGTADGKPWHRHIALRDARDGAGYLPRLWAQRHIAARLLAKHDAVTCSVDCAGARESRDEAIRQEVVALGKKYFLLSRHTSLLVLENDEMYAKYGVQKGSGETWAPYVLPPTIPHVTTAFAPFTPEDGELVRAPAYWSTGWNEQQADLDGHIMQETMPTTGMDREHLRDTVATRGTLGLRANLKPTAPIAKKAKADFATKGEMTKSPGPRRQAFVNDPFGDDWAPMDKRLDSNSYGRTRWLRGAEYNRFTNPSDWAFDDLTSFVPALFPDASDFWREHLKTETAGQVDDAARAQLAKARASLPAGVYRWGDREIAIDGAHRLGWRVTTSAGLDETASIDATLFTRRYAELGLDVTRHIGDDDVALALAYLPIWISEPDHYARWFDVTARGAHEVVLARDGKLAFVMTFDDHDRLVAMVDDAGNKVVEVTWGAVGPTAARVGGEAVTVAFKPEAIADASAWAHGSSHAGVAIELPMHVFGYWQPLAAKETVGSPQWRHDERQIMAVFAATQNRAGLFEVYEQLRANGGVERGDLVLASGATFYGETDDQLAKAVAPLAQEPVARYLLAARAYSKDAKPERLAVASHDGFVGQLWQLRSALAEVIANHGTQATDMILALGDRAPELRTIGTLALAGYNTISSADQLRAWNALPAGPYVNIIRGQIAQAYFSRGAYDDAAERIADLVAKLDVHALPASLDNVQYMFNASRRGSAGWQLVWAQLRERVLASDSYPQVIALLTLAAQHGDVTPVLARALELAGKDPRRRLEVARLAQTHGMSAWAEGVIAPMMQQAPSRELYQLAAQLAQAQGRTADALADLEHAQDAGSDEAVSIGTVRAELGQILGLCQQLAQQSSGKDRDAAVARALLWGNRWRAIDPGNTAIDESLGELLLTVGDRAGAWRQLSGAIERDPWSGQGYSAVAETFERHGRVAEALPFWHQAVIIDQTNPTPRLREAQALIALGRASEGDAILTEIADPSRHWHDAWSGVVYQARALLERGKLH